MMKYNLTSEQEEKMNTLKRDSETPNEFIKRVVDLGMYQLQYRRSEKVQLARKEYRKKRNEDIKEALKMYRASVQ